MDYASTPQTINQSVPVSQDEIYANVAQEERVRNFIEQISPEKQLIELQWRLKGYMKNPLTQEWEKIDVNLQEPSSLMISRYVSFASSILNQNTTMSNMSQSEINRQMKLIIEWYIDDMDSNAEEYGIGQNYSERTRIGIILFTFCSQVLRRSIDGIESKRVFGSLSLSENMAMANAPKKDWRTTLAGLAR